MTDNEIETNDCIFTIPMRVHKINEMMEYKKNGDNNNNAISKLLSLQYSIYDSFARTHTWPFLECTIQHHRIVTVVAAVKAAQFDVYIHSIDIVLSVF